ncbi:hypothetical protein FRC11_001629 [Ceratobasidium sp. 423]|nr:hypothetical protein FRC11_001629 [Ceratobasidium sp. 423]
MGKLSPPVCSPRAGSAVLSAVTGFFPFVVPQMVALSSVLAMLVDSVQEILGITEKSKCFVNFGKYVRNTVNQVISALQNNQLAQRTEMKKKPEGFHM